MIEVMQPKVRLVTEPHVLWDEVRDYLVDVGGEAWFDRVMGEEFRPHDAELLTEIMGRLCYRSWEPGLNKNVTKIREDHGDYLLNVMRQRHGSVLEHAHFGFLIHDCSRVITAELNRHRAGVAISEQSLRYVRLDALRFRVPPVLKPETQEAMRLLVEHIENHLAYMMEQEGLDDPDLDFGHKKMVTSALRHAAPLGLLTEEGITLNVRAIRHVISMRSAPGAEESIRIVADQMARIMQTRCPLLFGDYVETDGHWQTENWKV